MTAENGMNVRVPMFKIIFKNEEMNVRFSLLIVSIQSVVLACVLSSCSGNHSRMAAEVERLEKAAISDSTAVIDIAECRMKHFPLSRLIEEVEYVPLETSDSSVLYSVAQFKLTDSLIYVCDVMKQLKKFDRKGRYVGNAYTRGEGPEEVVQLYDFDVDEDFLYLLDGARSVVLRFTHQGEFVDRRSLPFRAICMKHLSDGRYLFRLAPFSLADEKEVSALLMLTDADFNPRGEFFAQNRDVEGTTLREPYFESSSDSRYFAPLYRRSIYRLEGDSLVMDYYLNFGTPYYETNRRYKGAEEAKERGIYYTFPNPIHTERYLLQAFITSRAQQGLLVIDRQTKRAVFAEGLENDRDDMLGFNIWSGMQTYDAATGRLAGIAESYYESSFSDEAELERIKSILPDSVVSVLLKKGNEELNPVLMFYRLREDIVK